jgi:hypothetical protein
VPQVSKWIESEKGYVRATGLDRRAATVADLRWISSSYVSGAPGFR